MCESAYVKAERERWQTYAQVCKPAWENIRNWIDQLLYIGGQQAIARVAEFLQKSEMQIFYEYYDELHMLLLAIEIYVQELQQGLEKTIFSDVHSIQSLGIKMQRIKFALLRMNFDIPLEQEANTWILSENISDILICKMMDLYCVDKESVSKKILKIKEQMNG